MFTSKRRFDAIDAALRALNLSIANLITNQRHIMSELDTLSADVAAVKASADAMATQITAAVANSNAQSQKLTDALAQLAAAQATNNDPALAALAATLEGVKSEIDSSASALAATVPAPAPAPAPTGQ